MLTLWKTLVLPHVEYCCQLWAPERKGDIQILKQVQKSFLSKIKDYSHLDYWDKLKKFGLYSLQRRRKRYIIIYTWRMIEKQVPDIGIQSLNHSRRGRVCVVPPLPKNTADWTRPLREISISVRGPMLFNLIPREIRGLSDMKGII